MRARIWVQQNLYNLGSEHFIPIFGPHVSSQRAAQVRQLYTVCVCVCDSLCHNPPKLIQTLTVTKIRVHKDVM